jgi:serine/threonine-protein kinase
MAMCPQCRAVCGDEVRTCPEHGCTLVPDELLSPADDALAEGTMVGEYRIDRKLGSGAFGDVYAGEHPLIGKRVAVKVLNRRFASDPEMVSRFIAEARAVNKIRQRNIIDIFSFGILRDKQQHYFVMELLDGLTLRELLNQKGRLPVPTVIQIVRGIAAALDAVHEAGITHRDLKPDNVFLATERDGTYFPKLLDFGIAKLIGDDVTHRTGSGVVLGTPLYMSPEQARGRKTDHLADIYALGVMIHEMLTGAAPFTGDSSVDVLLKHTTEPPPPMSSLRADLPSELDAPVLAMLHKRPKDRPPTAGRAVADLADCARRLGLERVNALAVLAVNVAKEAQDRLEGAEDTMHAVGQPMPWQVPTLPRVAPTRTTPQNPELSVTTPPPSGAPLLREPRGNVVTTLATPKLPFADVESSDDGVAGRSGPSTEGLAAVETGSSFARLGGTFRRRLLAVAVAGIAGGVSIWALGRGSGDPRTESPAGAGIVTSVPLSAMDPGPSPNPARHPAAIAPTSAAAAPTEAMVTTAVSAALPETIEVRLSTRPSDVEVWFGDQRVGTSSEPIFVPRGSGRVELQLKKRGFKDKGIELTPDRNQSLDATLSPLPAASRPDGRPVGKPAASPGRMERLLGDRD